MTVSSQISEKAATILVVEDDERMRAGLARAFESEGHRVLACGDAAEALRELHKEGCDIVVLDVELPGVSGLALCRLLRAQAATRRLPVIILSSHDREDYKVEAFAAGADDFVVKGADRARAAHTCRRAPRSRPSASACCAGATASYPSSPTSGAGCSTRSRPRRSSAAWRAPPSRARTPRSRRRCSSATAASRRARAPRRTRG